MLVFVALAMACGSSMPSVPTMPTPVATVPPPAPVAEPEPLPEPAPPPTPTPTRPPAAGPSLSVSHVLCFGDSITAGYISTFTVLAEAGSDAYPARLFSLLSDRYRGQAFNVENAGIYGEWAVDGQYRIVRTVRASHPDVVVLMEGINDINALGSRGIEPALIAIEDMLRDARALGARVILASLPPVRPGSRDGGAAALVPEFNSGVQSLARRQNVLFVDVNRAFGNDLTLLGPDGLHPTTSGYLRIAETVFEALRSNFERPETTSRTAGAPT
jgi:lysophospholipase L1-like esterase